MREWISPIIDRPEDTTEKVVPMVDRSFEAQEGFLRNGHPVIPPIWVRGRSMASMTGEYVSRHRISAEELEIDCHTRFLADDFDATAGVWRPFFTKGSDYYFRTPAGLSPVHRHLEYRVGKEVLTVPALRFTPGDYMLSEFNRGADQAGAFSIAMVMMIEPELGYTIISSQADQEEVAVHADTAMKITYGDHTVTASAPFSPTSLVPAYVILSLDGMTATLSFGSSSTKVHSATISNRHLEMNRLKLTIGRTQQGKSTGTFHLMEFVLFDHPLNRVSEQSVTDVISRLSGVYGG